jgi:hypothetical protein
MQTWYRYSKKVWRIASRAHGALSYNRVSGYQEFDGTRIVVSRGPVTGPFPTIQYPATKSLLALELDSLSAKSLNIGTGIGIVVSHELE